jgi:hypothetical protein
MSSNDFDVMEDKNKSDFASLFVDGCKQIPYKRVFFLFLFMMFVFSDFFISNILSQIKDTTYMDTTTTKGTLIQIIIVLVMYIGIDILVGNNII